MVINPRNYQKGMTWCVETALGLLFDAINVAGEKISSCQITDYFETQFHGECIDKRRLSRMAYDLKRSKYIEVADGDSVVLTNKARIRIIEKTILESSDGKFRIVSFDIPESMKVNRNGFRRAIKRMGFVQIQKSLWVTDRNVGDAVELAAVEYKVSDYVAYFVSNVSNIDHHILSAITKSSTKLVST
jgi:DNA-binding transcriptional regulator PaaX